MLAPSTVTARPARVNLLKGTRVYLSGPMDFVASRTNERAHGWRNRVGQFLRESGATVFDPWFKPLVKGMERFGYEDDKSADIREEWTFAAGERGARARAACAAKFRGTVDKDLRMVDLSDFIIAYCPTNLYSVGTPHEIVMARLQHKPVLFVSPPVVFDAFEELRQAAANDVALAKLVERVEQEVPIKGNAKSLPSLWYMGVVDPESFFDGFGFAKYAGRFKWKPNAVDEREARQTVARPLLAFLERLAEGHFPKRWSPHEGKFVNDDDWLLMDLKARQVA
jgi:hypothetical protein